MAYWGAAFLSLSLLLGVVLKMVLPSHFGGDSLLGRTNIAFGKSVRMSSVCAQRPYHSPMATGPAALTDGNKMRYYDACTKRQKRPWVRVDLEHSETVDTVVVTGRQELGWSLDVLPLVLEVSGDGREYQQVARRNVPLSDRRPWRASFQAVSARYWRVRSLARGSAMLVLTEIEIFGRSN